MSRCDAEMEDEEKMRIKIFEKSDKENNEIFEQYVYAIGTGINDLNAQVEEVY